MDDLKTASEIRIRDPFILRVPEEGLFYMYGTTGYGFDCYASRDLVEWAGPSPAFRPGPGFWGDRDFWAPEVHVHAGRYYMFASFKAEGACRGTQILVAHAPSGPFEPWSRGPVTPADWESLDGTLHWEDGAPWLVFCHEWVQVGDGTICALPLSQDLAEPVGEPVTLFAASDACWPRNIKTEESKVTDGPFLYTSVKGELSMLWSSFATDGYATAVARSSTGRLAGPWVHDECLVFTADGGHAMVFRDWAGSPLISLHSPNSGIERPVFLSYPDCAAVGGAVLQALARVAATDGEGRLA